MANNPPAINIADHLNAEREALLALVSLLETEQQALIDGNADPLLALSESKILAANKLKELEQVLRNGLLAHGMASDTDGILQWLQGNAAACVPIWLEIQQVAEKLQGLNRSNGLLIQTRLRHTQQALAALQNAANSAQGLYGADGQPHIPSSGRILGSV